MPAKSKSQQRFMGMVHAYKNGTLNMDNMSEEFKIKIRRAAENITMKKSDEFASTKHKSLPEKKASWVQRGFKNEISKLAGVIKHMPKVMSKFKYKNALNQLKLDNPVEHARLMNDSKAMQRFLRKNIK